ncbi:MAG: hypothetical protein M0R03_20070, partial [Novosphingobium sp.]|nr:hypothetical protein [Novosphingobium sp.]
MDSKEVAIKLWMDESTEVDNDYTLVGYLITDCSEKEYSFFRDLTKARESLKCFTTLHGNKIKEWDIREINLFDKWLEVFEGKNYQQGIYFHVFLYKEDKTKISKGKNIENYFAKQ